MNVKPISMRNKKSKTNWKKIRALSENEIIAAAKSDPNATPLSLSELKKFKRVIPTKKIDVKAIRDKLHLSQDEFAGYFGVSIRTLQEWEQHRRLPSATARNFLKVIDCEPKAVLRALSSHK
jgi:putative transcriptional regulator